MTKPAERCVVLVGYPSLPRQCSSKGSREYRGERYCNIHYPPVALARVKEKVCKQQAEWAAKKRAAGADAIRKAEQRVLKAAWHCNISNIGNLTAAVIDLVALGWEPES